MARSKRAKVSELAAETGLGLEETLLALWEAGISSVADPNDVIVGAALKQARTALKVPSRRELKSPSYWKALLKLDDGQFSDLLAVLKIKMGPYATTLPKGSVRKLKTESLKRFAVAAPPLPLSHPVPEPKVPPKLQWKTIGHQRRMRMLNLEEVKSIHFALVKDFVAHDDPIDSPGPRDEHLLASAVFRPQTSIGSQLKYPTVEMAAAALLHSLVHNHPFHNGNKRTALVAMLMFLDENGLMLTCSEEDLFKFVLQVAQHRITNPHPNGLADREVIAIAEWLHQNCRNIERGDRPLQFRKLRQILSRYDCEFEHGTNGSKLKITRTVKKQGTFGRVRLQKLSTNIFYGGEGREVRQNSINKVRSDLELNEDHGIDSAGFYDESPFCVDDFIVQYRKTLRRLAKV